MILGAATYTARHAAPGTWSAGVYTPGTETTYTVVGSLQPASGEQLQLLPEGARSDTRWLLYCDAQQPEIVLADIVEVSGADYLVTHVEDWTGHRPAHRVYALGEVTSV